MDCSPPSSSVHGISQERILEWVAISFSRRSFWPRDWTCVSCIGRQILYHRATRLKDLKDPMLLGHLIISRGQNKVISINNFWRIKCSLDKQFFHEDQIHMHQDLCFPGCYLSGINYPHSSALLPAQPSVTLSSSPQPLKICQAPYCLRNFALDVPFDKKLSPREESLFS